MKISPLSLLLATTFLSTSAFALTTDELGTSDHIKWESATSSDYDVEVNTTDGIKYFKYSYKQPSNYTEISGNIWINTNNQTVDGYYFNGTSGNTVNNGNYTDIKIISDFAYGERGVSNTGTISSINGVFFGNQNNYGQPQAGAIYNEGIITSIVADFINNSACYNGYDALGGAIVSAKNPGKSGIIDSITGDFIANNVYSSSGSAVGGAMYLFGGSQTGTIKGDFIANYAQGYDIARGGAITLVTGENTQGTAPYSSTPTSIQKLEGNFVDNYTKANDTAEGGAIYNLAGNITQIEGSFEKITQNHMIIKGMQMVGLFIIAVMPGVATLIWGLK